METKVAGRKSRVMREMRYTARVSDCDTRLNARLISLRRRASLLEARWASAARSWSEDCRDS